jgi:hypothetical protein
VDNVHRPVGLLGRINSDQQAGRIYLLVTGIRERLEAFGHTLAAFG